MESRIALHEYPNRQALAEALATGIAAVLAGAIATRGSATLVVSGGSTPKLMFERLSQAEIDWSAVTVTLVDERWVPETNDRSNAAMLKRHLLTNRAGAARFEPLYEDAPDPEDVADELDRRFKRLARPFDVTILGMGSDGHTASFFPGGDTLMQAIAPNGSEPIVPIRAPGAGEPRVTMTLPMFVDARFLAIHIEGDDKMIALDKAKTDGPVEEYPVRAVLRAERETPVKVFWAP